MVTDGQVFGTGALTNAVVHAAAVPGTGAVLVRARHDGGTYAHTASDDLAVTVISRLSGRCFFDLGDREFAGRPRPNDWVLKAPYVAAHIVNDGSYSGKTLRIPYSHLTDLAGEGGGLPPDGDFGRLHERLNHEGAVPHLVHLLDASTRTDLYGPLYVDGILLQLAATLLRQRSPKQSPIPGTHLTGNDPRVARAIDFLEANISDHPGLAVVAREVGLSARQLERAFRRTTGLSPHRWLLRQRIRRACDLLADTKRSVSAVASSCGFSSPQHLATAFKAHMGVTPGQYRRLLN